VIPGAGAQHALGQLLPLAILAETSALASVPNKNADFATKYAIQNVARTFYAAAEFRVVTGFGAAHAAVGTWKSS
jgi:hypothetical protein